MHEYFKQNISKKRYIYVYTSSDTDRESIFHLYSRNAQVLHVLFKIAIDKVYISYLLYIYMQKSY